MGFLHHFALCCPRDRLPLKRADASLRCDAGHSFDIARKGYVNLLAAEERRSREPGDSRDMVAARHRFLQAGHYAAIAEAVHEILRERIRADSLVLDAGCGEGYYLEHLRNRVQEAGNDTAAWVAVDISKAAVQKAARRFPGTWLVASNRNIPLADASASVVLDLFGFAHFEEFRRVLKPSGVVLRATAGAGHLLELRELLYDKVKPGTSIPPVPTGWQQIGQRSIRYPIRALGREAVADLLAMTPHGFRAPPQGKARAAALDRLDVTVDVKLNVICPGSPGNA